ncbi:MAG: nuclear transport factor 2 family protein [Leptospiraceae bacterium]|nr:nuclear transport factor 2 family protein [Leptospiraceae bacterium]
MKKIISILLFIFTSSIYSNEKKEVEDFLNKYFSSWSSGDIATYASLFHPSANIQFQDSAGNINNETLVQFIKNQKASIEQSPEKMVEIPLSKDLKFKDKICYAIVRWKLTTKSTNVTGVDHFVLSKVSGVWKIQFLYFYAE